MRFQKLISNFLMIALMSLALGPLVFIEQAPAAVAVNLGAAENYQVLSGTAATIGAAVVGLNSTEVGVSATAVSDLVAAMTVLNALPSVGVAADLGGQRYFKGNYFSAAAVAVTSNIILDAQGDAGATFVFTTPAAMNTTAGITMTLANGANPCNVYWVAGGAFTFGASGQLVGNFLGAAAVTVGASSQVDGRFLAAAAVTVGASVTFSGSAVSRCKKPAGGLAISVPQAFYLGEVTAGGSISGDMGEVKVIDTRSSIGVLSWDVSVEATQFRDNSANTIGNDKLSYELKSLVGATGLHLVATDLSSLQASGSQSLKVLSATTGSSGDEVTWKPRITIRVPFGQVAGNYSGAIIHSVY
jgi:hypothetical protein